MEELLDHPPARVDLTRQLHQVRVQVTTPGGIDPLMVVGIAMIFSVMSVFLLVGYAEMSLILAFAVAPMFLGSLVLFVIRGLRAAVGSRMKMLLTDTHLQSWHGSGRCEIRLRDIHTARYDRDNGAVLVGIGVHEIVIGRMSRSQGQWLVQLVLTAVVEALEQPDSEGVAEEVPEALLAMIRREQPTGAL